jgi:hypothetical protein
MRRRKARRPATAAAEREPHGSSDLGEIKGTVAKKQDSAQPPLKNLRPLTEITADIFTAERQSRFTVGKLLREAKEHFPHGKWIPYLKSIDWSERTAQQYMAISELADKYATVAHLNAAPTALYHLIWLQEREDEADKIMPLAIKRLQDSVARGESPVSTILANPYWHDLGFERLRSLVLEERDKESTEPLLGSWNNELWLAVRTRLGCKCRLAAFYVGGFHACPLTFAAA